MLLSSFICGQNIAISASSLHQVAADDFLNATCLTDANPGVDTLSAGDTFAVPLDCCGAESFVCGGAFCTLLADCVNLQTGVGSISATTVASTIKASVTGTMVSQGSDGTITSTAQASGTDAGTTATTTSTSSDAGGAAGGGAGGAGGAGGGGGGGTATTGAGTTTNAETTAAPTDTTQASSTTQSTTSSSSSGTPTPTAWLISTKRNTVRADFDEFIKTLPDQGQGNVIAYDNIPWQSYVTENLTSDQADMMKMNSIVDMVGQITEEDGEAGIAATRKPRVMKRENSPRAARSVLAASTDSDTSTTMLDGTSLAAPAVAGMAAYFSSLPELDANWPQGSVARAMEHFFVLSARVQRNNNPIPPNLGYAGPAPGSVVVACKSSIVKHDPWPLRSRTMYRFEQQQTNAFAGNRHPATLSLAAACHQK